MTDEPATCPPSGRVLVVDDNPDNLELIEAQLHRAGYAVAFAASGRAALQQASSADLILLDVMMPGLDGYEVCRRLKADPGTRAIPVVMLTSLNERADKVRALEAGADDFLTKPVDSAELIARVRSLLRARTLDDDLSRSRGEIAAQADQLAAEKGRAEAILYSIADGVFTTDLAGRVTLLNAAAEHLTGITHDEALGRDWRDALGVIDVTGQTLGDDACPVRAALRADVNIDGRDVKLWRHDGVEVTLNLRIAPVRRAGGPPIGAVGVLRDVTRQREVERLKHEFVALVSHELRGPTAVILGFAEILLNYETLSERGHRFAETIHRESLRLGALIQDFLDVERLDAGGMTFHPRSLLLDALAVEIRADLAPQLERRRLILDFPADPIIVRADRERLTQVLGNLVTNAIKYSPGGGDIHLRAREADGTATISIVDHGLGLPPDAVERLFEKFYRVDRPQHREIGGTGLGLAICRRLVQGMGGRIWAESQGENRGSTFSFTLPTSSDAALVIEPTSETRPSRILVVNNDPGLADLITAELREDGYDVEVATTGAEALTRARAAWPAAVVLDLRLDGDLDGWAVLTALRDDPRMATLPIIVLAGAVDEAYGLALGVHDYLVKPVAARVFETIRAAAPPRHNYLLVAGDDATVPRLVGEALREAGLVAPAR